jgi:hypothetical protein
LTNALELPLNELLDRYELLYPEVSAIADLRRAFIDRDLSSIFRLCDENEELRKAVVDENLHSMFRILEPMDIPGLEDIRKSVIEKNLNSLFRLFSRQTNWHIDDLRRAVLEENLYSLFRLFSEEDEDIHLYRTAIVNKNLRSIFKLLGNDNLRKLIIDENVYKLWPILSSYVDTQFTSAFKSFFINNTDIDNDCFSRGQLQSKLWLVDELKKCNVDLGTVFLCAGWYATLATMLFESDIKVDKVRSFDIDPSCIDIAETFNKPWFMETWRFKSITQDIMDIDYDTHKWQSWSNANNRMSRPITDTPDTIINTSCEHISDFAEWYAKIPDGKLVVLQSNNFFKVAEHVNCVNDIEEFKSQAPMSQVLYSGKLALPKYKRFMRIGYK